MKKFRLLKIWILSDMEKKANVFTFGPKLNLITSTKNSVGKSTLSKIILWAFGSEPFFDSQWKKQDILAKIHFEIGDNSYTLFRYQNNFALENLGTLQHFQNFKEYIEFFCNLVNFFPMLANRKTQVLELPPPAYYFLPFYIDQKKGWSRVFTSFQNLGQYAHWQKPIIKYYCGLTNTASSRIDYEISKYNYNKNIYQNEVKDLKNTLETNNLLINEFKFENNYTRILNEKLELIEEDYTNLIYKQNDILSSIALERNSIIDLTKQRKYSIKLVNELTNDFIFVNENYNQNSIECPLCGTYHTNSIVERSKLLKEKDDLVQLIEEMDIKIKQSYIKIEKLKKSLNEITKNIILFHKENQLNPNEIISVSHIDRSIGIINDKALLLIESKNNLIEKINRKIDEKEYEKNLVKNDVAPKDIKNEFKDLVISFNKKLATDFPDEFLSNISVFDYMKFDTNGGAADSTRSIFLYHCILIKLIEKFSNIVLFPFIIDTPNQQEQEEYNYENMISMLMANFYPNMQIFICAMQNNTLDSIKSDCHVITLSNKKSLLLSEKYEHIKPIFNLFQQDISKKDTKAI